MFKTKTENKSKPPEFGHNQPLHTSALAGDTRPLSEDFTDDERTAIEAARERLAEAEARLGEEIERQIGKAKGRNRGVTPRDTYINVTPAYTRGRLEVSASKAELRELEKAASEAAQLRRLRQ